MLEPAREIHGLVALWSSRLLNGTPFSIDTTQARH